MENKIEQRKALNLLGLARKAGKLTTGQDLVLAAIRSGKAKVVLMANDCGQSTQKKFTDKCKSYDVALTTEMLVAINIADNDIKRTLLFFLFCLYIFKLLNFYFFLPRTYL